MRADDITEALADSEALLLEPRSEYDPCLIGIGYRYKDGPLAVYDIEAVLTVLGQDGMTEEEAVEFFEFNVAGAWVGDSTPAFLTFRDENE